MRLKKKCVTITMTGHELVCSLKNKKSATEWTAKQARHGKVSSKIGKAILATIITNPAMFLFRNMGITIVNEVTIANGGTTYQVLLKAFEMGLIDELKKVEVKVTKYTGLTRNEVADTCDALNSANNMPAHCIANIRGVFDSIKRVVKGTKWADQIAWRKDSTKRRPIKVIDLLRYYAAALATSPQEVAESYKFSEKQLIGLLNNGEFSDILNLTDELLDFVEIVTAELRDSGLKGKFYTLSCLHLFVQNGPKHVKYFLKHSKNIIAAMTRDAKVSRLEKSAWGRSGRGYNIVQRATKKIRRVA